jgi:hypothetical protein
MYETTHIYIYIYINIKNHRPILEIFVPIGADDTEEETSGGYSISLGFFFRFSLGNETDDLRHYVQRNDVRMYSLTRPNLQSAPGLLVHCPAFLRFCCEI